MRDLSAAERRELLKSQTGKLKETLAAMSLIEAEEALEEGDLPRAINSLHDAIKNFPENPFYYIKLSEVFQSESKIPEAIKTLNLALTYCPNNPVVKNKILVLETVSKKLSQADSSQDTHLQTNVVIATSPIDSRANTILPPLLTSSLPTQLSSSVKSNYAKFGLPGVISTNSSPTENLPKLGKDKTVPLPVKILTKAQLDRRDRKKELKTQTGRLKETLAEMSLIESEECLDRGDRLGAINSLQDAIKNYPENPVYYLRLVEIHVQDNKTPDAIKLLNTALEYTPQHQELTKKLEELEEYLKPKNIIAPPQAIDPKELKEIPAEVLADIDAHVEQAKTTNEKQQTTKLNVNKLLCPKCNILNDINDVKCSNCNTPLSRFNRLKTKSQETIVELSNRLKARNVAILIIIAIVIVISFPIAKRENAIVVEPLEPIDKSVLDIRKAEFQWDTVAENIGFLLTIEKDGKKIIERYTSNLIYTLTYEEMGRLEANEVYSWEVTPISPKRQTLNYRTKKLEFRLAPLTPTQSGQENLPPISTQENSQSAIQQSNKKPSQGKALDDN